MWGIFVSWFNAWNQKEKFSQKTLVWNKLFWINCSRLISSAVAFFGTTSPEAEKPAWQVVITSWKDLIGPKRYFYIYLFKWQHLDNFQKVSESATPPTSKSSTSTLPSESGRAEMLLFPGLLKVNIIKANKHSSPIFMMGWQKEIWKVVF